MKKTCEGKRFSPFSLVVAMLRHWRGEGKGRVDGKWMMLAVLVLPFCGHTSSADVIYSEDFTTAVQTSVAAFGWSAYQNNGTDLSSSASGALTVLSNGRVFIGSGNGVQGGAFALISDAPDIDPAGYGTDLAITITQFGTDRTIADPMGWRILLQVGSTWYATDLLPFSSSSETRSAVVSDPVWRTWETDLTDGFNFNSGFGTPGNLPAGIVVGIGVLAVDGVSAENDSLNLDSFVIAGTVVPEPASFGLLAAGLAIGYMGWRRKQHG